MLECSSKEGPDFTKPQTFTFFSKTATEQLKKEKKETFRDPQRSVVCLHDDVFCSVDDRDRMYTVSSLPASGCFDCIPVVSSCCILSASHSGCSYPHVHVHVHSQHHEGFKLAFFISFILCFFYLSCVICRVSGD